MSAIISESPNEAEIRHMGWALLLMWMTSIAYMTRDYWFPSIYGLEPISDDPRLAPSQVSAPSLHSTATSIPRRRYSSLRLQHLRLQHQLAHQQLSLPLDLRGTHRQLLLPPLRPVMDEEDEASSEDDERSRLYSIYTSSYSYEC